jgi:DNA-binding transcriptional LysR family regulator
MPFDGRMLSNISALAAIVEGGSFARAADALGLSPSGVSRAVARLESRIGVRLLDRTTRSVMLTDEGRRLYEEICPLLANIGDAVNVTAGASAAVRGRLRVNVDSFFSRLVLAPNLAKLLDRSPPSQGKSVHRFRGRASGHGCNISLTDSCRLVTSAST